MKPILDDQVKALWKLGFVRPIDFLLLLTWMAVLATAIYFWSTDTLTVIQALIFIFAEVTIVSLWVMIVIFRICYNVFVLRADVLGMPAAAAQLALAYRLKP
jgi:hypothetical protein